MKENEIYTALENVGRLAGIETSAELSPSKDYWLAQIGTTVFAVLHRTSVTTQNRQKCNKMISELRDMSELPVIVVTSDISRSVLDEMAKEGISVVETSGNCRISEGSLFINIYGQKKNTESRQSAKPYTEARLKVIFFILLSKGNVAMPFREISQGTGVSLGVVKYTFDDLYAKKFVVDTPKGRVLKNFKGLLDLWSIHYNQTMKPKLRLLTFKFARSEYKAKWESITLPDGMKWGGEPAAAIMDGYLKPESFEIYSDQPGMKLISTAKFVPSPNGEVKVYGKFWKGEESKIAPMILAYADLMGSGDSRCIEAAQRLLDKTENYEKGI